MSEPFRGERTTVAHPAPSPFFSQKNDVAVIVLCQETTELWAICETMLVCLSIL